MKVGDVSGRDKIGRRLGGDSASDLLFSCLPLLPPDCELVALLEDDTGMELLVCNKIISLDLPVKDVFKKIWCAQPNVRSSYACACMHTYTRTRMLRCTQYTCI